MGAEKKMPRNWRAGKVVRTHKDKKDNWKQYYLTGKVGHASADLIEDARPYTTWHVCNKKFKLHCAHNSLTLFHVAEEALGYSTQLPCTRMSLLEPYSPRWYDKGQESMWVWGLLMLIKEWEAGTKIQQMLKRHTCATCSLIAQSSPVR